MNEEYPQIDTERFYTALAVVFMFFVLTYVIIPL